MRQWKVSQAQVDELYEVLDLIQESQALSPVMEARLEKSIWSLQLVPLVDLGHQYETYATDLATELKLAILWETQGMDLQVSSLVRDTMSKALIHAIRNSLDHGVETPDERKNAGKSARAKLKLEATLTCSGLKLIFSDDGRGPQWDRIAAKAEKMGWGSSEATRSLEVLFEPGFSTEDAASDLSGRGMGLDAIREGFRKLGGEVTARGESGVGFSLEMQIPLEAVGLEVRQLVFAEGAFFVPATAVQEEAAMAGVSTLRNGFLRRLGWQQAGSGSDFVSCRVYGEPVRAAALSVAEMRYFRALDVSWGHAGSEWLKQWIKLSQGRVLSAAVRGAGGLGGRALVPLLDSETWRLLNE